MDTALQAKMVIHKHVWFSIGISVSSTVMPLNILMLSVYVCLVFSVTVSVLKAASGHDTKLMGTHGDSCDVWLIRITSLTLFLAILSKP